MLNSTSTSRHGAVLLSSLILGILLAMAQINCVEADEDPLPQLLIIGVDVDNTGDILTIDGENFDNGTPPVVLLDEFELTVTGYSASTIDTSIKDVPGDLEGEYLLDVRTGDAEEQHDTHCLEVDSNDNVLVCDELSISKWEQKNRMSVRYVPKGPPGAETDNLVLFTWKDGPSWMNSGSNAWGDPKWFQLLEDYTIDLRFILENYPNELARCDDRYLGDQRSTRLEFLEDVNCLEWSEDKNNPECVANTDDPGEGYLLLKDGKLTVRKGYRWDGASMVFPFTEDVRIYPKTAALMRSTIVHDALYDMLRMKIPNARCGSDWINCRFQFQKLADCMLYMLSRQDGYKKSKARSNFTIVRDFGWTKTIAKMPGWKTHALADAGPDQTLHCAPQGGVSVTLDSSGTKFASSKRIWKENGLEISGTTNQAAPTVNFPPGSHRVTLDVEYGDGMDWLRDDSREVLIEVIQDTTNPEFTSVENVDDVPNDPGQCSANVDFEVKANDDCGCPTIACAPTPGSWFDVGTTEVSCSATDIGENTVSTWLTVTVDDIEPPVITGITEPKSIWPPNHKYWTFTIEDFVHSVSDNCTEMSMDEVKIIRVTSDEVDDASGLGDGSTNNDIVIAADGKSVQLRQERQGSANGRVYTIYVEASDDSSNTSSVPFQVHVVDDRKGHAVDSGAVMIEDAPVTTTTITIEDGFNLTTKIEKSPLPAIDFSTEVTSGTVSLTITDTDLSDTYIDSIKVFWGDRHSSEYTDKLPATIVHTYSRTGTHYRIRVKIIYSNGDQFNYTSQKDEDLRVSIP